MSLEHDIYLGLLIFVAGLGCGVIGMDLAYERQKSREAAIPKRVQVDGYFHAQQLINCDGGLYNATVEVARICKARRKSEAVGGR